MEVMFCAFISTSPTYIPIQQGITHMYTCTCIARILLVLGKMNLVPFPAETFRHSSEIPALP